MAICGFFGLGIKTTMISTLYTSQNVGDIILLLSNWKVSDLFTYQLYLWTCQILIPRAPQHAVRTYLELEYSEIHLYTKDPAERKQKISLNLTQDWGLDYDQFQSFHPPPSRDCSCVFLPWVIFNHLIRHLSGSQPSWLCPMSLGWIQKGMVTENWDQQEIKQKIWEHTG